MKKVLKRGTRSEHLQHLWKTESKMTIAREEMCLGKYIGRSQKMGVSNIAWQSNVFDAAELKERLI